MHFLVMEYLEGETLADRLLRGPLPVEQVSRYGVEIVDALDKAHRQGIVHRDLKPGNIMLNNGIGRINLRGEIHWTVWPKTWALRRGLQLSSPIRWSETA